MRVRFVLEAPEAKALNRDRGTEVVTGVLGMAT